MVSPLEIHKTVNKSQDWLTPRIKPITLFGPITLVGDKRTHSLGLRVSQRAAPSLALAVATSLDSMGLKTTPWKAELHTASSTGSEIKK